MLPETISYARYNLGVSHYLRNEFDLAAPLLVSLQQDWAVSAPSYVAYGTFALALIRYAQGKTIDAEHLIDWLFECYPLGGGTSASKIAEACGVELQLRMGNLVEARRRCAQTDFGFRPPIWFFWVHQLTPIKLQLAEGAKDSLAAARASLEILHDQMRKIHRNSVCIDVLALLALVCDAQGERSAAGNSLVQALKLARPGGFFRNFVDLGPQMAKLLERTLAEMNESIPELVPYASRILAAFGSEEQGSADMEAPPDLRPRSLVVAMPKPLTEREHQVLELLASDLSPREIARELVISPATVQTHTKNVFRKLDVTSRYEAVYRARELALI